MRDLIPRQLRTVEAARCALRPTMTVATPNPTCTVQMHKKSHCDSAMAAACVADYILYLTYAESGVPWRS